MNSMSEQGTEVELLDRPLSAQEDGGEKVEQDRVSERALSIYNRLVIDNPIPTDPNLDPIENHPFRAFNRNETGLNPDFVDEAAGI